ncbi:MAG: indole-3-glycerol-phosphate synthase [Nannocystis sp.]|nr:indole-3-glycerol-phosphate synthase [Nannocystis sp.]
MTSDGQSYLDKILAEKRADLSAARAGRSSALSERDLGELGARLPRPRDFNAALRAVRPAPAIIAEFKRATPEQGVLCADADPRSFATHFAAAGAAAISVVTDRHYQGNYEDLRAIRQTVTLPLLCRDFILERWQIVEAKRCGADAVVLIAAALAAPLLRQLIDFARAIDMQVLCEAHSEQEVDRAMTAGARMVSVHARDLRSSQVDLGRCAAMRALVPRGFTYVAEGGVASAAELRRLAEAEVDAVVIGSALMRAERPGEALQGLIEAI